MTTLEETIADFKAFTDGKNTARFMRIPRGSFRTEPEKLRRSISG